MNEFSSKNSPHHDDENSEPNTRDVHQLINLIKTLEQELLTTLTANLADSDKNNGDRYII